MTSPIQPIRVDFSRFTAMPVNRLDFSPGSGDPRRNAGTLELSPAALAAQSELDSIRNQIGRTIDSRGAGASGFSVEDVSTALSRLRVGDVSLEQGQSLDVEVDITASAQQAGLYLSFGAHNFTAFNGLSIQVEGRGGARELTFEGAVSLAEITGEINKHTGDTGVYASTAVNPLGVAGFALYSSGHGSDDFVSVSVVGSTPNDARGVYQLDPQNARAVDMTSGTGFSQLDGQTVTDLGQDVAAIVNGQAVTGQGTMVSYTGPQLTAQFDLALGALGQGETANAENLGMFLAFRVLWDEPRGPLSDTPPGIDLKG